MRIDGCFKKSFIICIPSEQQQFLQCRTKQALRPGAQAKAIWPEIGAAAVLSSSTDEMPEPSCDGVNKWCRCYKEHSNAYTQSKPGREHRFKINSFACHSEFPFG